MSAAPLPEAGASPPSQLTAERPWPGLAAFREEDAEYFVARNRDTDVLAEHVLAQRLTVLYGQSGLGKTSLLQAGLFPRLRRELCFPVSLRLSFVSDAPPLVEQIFAALERAAESSAAAAPERAPFSSLWEFLHRKGAAFWSPRNRVLTPVLVFDQFEELFTRGADARPAECQALLESLADLAESRTPRALVEQLATEGGSVDAQFDRKRLACRIILTLREDYLAALEEQRFRMPSVMEGRVRLMPFNGAQALEVVRRGGALVPHEVAPRIVTSVAGERQRGRRPDEQRIDPALLCLLCSELNERRLRADPPQPQVRADWLGEQEETRILRDFYERAVHHVRETTRDFIEEHLLLPSGLRNSVAIEIARDADVTASEVDRLVNERLLRREDRGGVPCVELTHDVLSRPVRESRDERRAKKEAEERERQTLEEAEVRERAIKEQAARDREEQERRQTYESRRRRQQVRWASAVALISLIFAAIALWLLVTAHRAKRETGREAARAERLVDQAARADTVAGMDHLDRPSEALAYFARALRYRATARGAAEQATVLLSGRQNAMPSAVLRGHSAEVTSAVFSPDGARILTASKDKTARLWDSASGRHLATLQGHTAAVTSAAFSPDGARILTASEDNTTRVWESASGRHLATLQGHTAAVTSAAFSPDGARILTASNDGTARIWDAPSGKLLATLDGHTAAVTSAAFSPDGARVLTVCNDNTARIWDAVSGKPLATLDGHTAAVTSAAFSPDGARVLTASYDNTARIWDTVSGKPLATLRGRSMFGFTSAVFNPVASRILIASTDHTAGIWDAVSGKPLATLRGHTGAVASAAFSPDGARVLTASYDNTVRIWDAAFGNPLAVLQGHTGTVTSAALSPDSFRVLTASADNTARIWDAASGKPLAILQGHTSIVTSAAFSPDGSRVLTASADNTARIWDAVSGKPLVTLQGHTDSITSAVFSSDGSRVLTASVDNAARIWEATSGKPLVTLQGHTNIVTSAAFDPDGSRVLTTSADNTARIWCCRAS